MAFTGRDYHQAFEEACDKLPYGHDVDAVRSELEEIEWILWEAIRGVFFYVSFFTGILIVAPIAYLLDVENLIARLFVFPSVTFLIAIIIYWLCRLVFHYEIAAHVKGRKFGSGGLD